MDKIDYLTKLSEALYAAGYDDAYVLLCTEYASRLLENGLPVIFDTEHFSRILGVDREVINKYVFASDYYYTEATIPKKSGGVRILQIPSLELKRVQRWIVDSILKKIRISEYATGFCDGASIVRNATKHLKKECVVSMDIQDFFPSISFETVFRIFNYYGYTKELSFFFAKLCTYNNELPQGSPASPWLSNIACLKLDKRLAKLAERYESDYTRYADDITFSGSKYIGNIIKTSILILNDENFKVNERKTRVAFKKDRQEVTGLIVNNDSVRVDRRYKRSLWQEIYYCQKYGMSDHLNHINCNKAFYKEHLYGKVYFVNMVEPLEGKKMLEALDQIAWDY